MTDYKMTDERKEVLAKFLGYKQKSGCWVDDLNIIHYLCEDSDMLAVFRKIRDKGKLSKFDMFCQDIFLEYTGYDNICDMCNEYQNWLFLDNPERACCLAAMWLEEQG